MEFERHTEYNVREACSEYLDTGNMRAAARNHGVPYTTLRGRLSGKLPKSTAQVNRQRLSIVQEERLTQWILLQSALGCPPTHRQIRQMAQGVCVARGDFDTIGRRWCTRFFRRNPVLKTIRKKGTDSIRISNATEEVIRPWFEHLSIPAITRIQPYHRWNMDETRLASGLGSNGLVVSHRDHKALQRKQPGNRTWTTIIEAISATGDFLDPLVIFKGRSLQQQWFPTNLKVFKD